MEEGDKAARSDMGYDQLPAGECDANAACTPKSFMLVIRRAVDCDVEPLAVSMNSRLYGLLPGPLMHSNKTAATRGAGRLGPLRYSLFY